MAQAKRLSRRSSDLRARDHRDVGRDYYLWIVFRNKVTGATSIYTSRARHSGSPNRSYRSALAEMDDVR